jgi:hypothetical protein
VESLLEAGFEQERIRVFAGGEMKSQGSQLPPVSLARQSSDHAEMDI